MVAPAGYGKTTLLAQWAQHKGPRVGWVSVDQRDNDPAVLLTYLAVALDRIESIDPSVFRALGGPGASIMGAATRLAAAVAAMPEPVALVLDHVELLGNQHAWTRWPSWPRSFPPGRSCCWRPEPSRRCRWHCCAPRAGWWSSGPTSWRWTTRRRSCC